MKKITLLVFSFVAMGSVFAQGTLDFRTRITSTPVINAPIYDMVVGDTNALLTAGNFFVALYGGLQGTPTNSLSLGFGLDGSSNQVTFVSFQSTRPGYVDSTINGTISTTWRIPGVGANTNATVQVRAWSAAGGTNWDQAVLAAQANPNIKVGVSDPITVQLTDPLSPSQPRLVGLASFAVNPLIAVPEPSVVALVAIGGLGLVLRRRK